MQAVTYHPISDPYHCAYRMLSMIGCSNAQNYSIEKFRILDFYHLFPSLIKNIRRTRPLMDALKNISSDVFKEPYQILPDSRLLFRQLEGVQLAAINHLAAKDFLSVNALKDNLISPSKTKDAIQITGDIFEASKIQPYISILVTELNAIDLHGSDGLKARTKLMEFRYDNI